MDAQTFSLLLQKPYLLSDYSLADLQNLLQQHSYSPVVYALIALKAHRENHRDYEHHLNRAAIRVPDRKQLYHLIHSSPVLVTPEDVEDVEDVRSEPPALPQSLPQITISASAEEKKSLAREESKHLQEESLLKVSVLDNTKHTVTKKESTPPAFELPGVDDAIEALKSIRENEPAEKVEESAAVEPMLTNEEPAKSGKNARYSFTEWLASFKKTSVQGAAQAVIREIKESHAEEIHIPTSAPAADEAAVIVQRAQASLSDDTEWVTETLAKIYELQKKYDKAIEAYRMLGLKYPDKKAYFAQRIERIRGLKS